MSKHSDQVEVAIEAAWRAIQAVKEAKQAIERTRSSTGLVEGALEAIEAVWAKLNRLDFGE